MSYMLNTPDDQKAMLRPSGLGSMEELFARHSRRACGSDGLWPCRRRLREMELHAARRGAGRPQSLGRRRGLLPRRRQLRPFHSGRGRCGRRPRRILHLLHALPGRGQPGKLAGVLRISDADQPADRHGRRQRQPVRRRQRRGRGRADGHERHRPNAARSSSPSSVHPEYRQMLATYLANLDVQRRRRCRRPTASSIPTMLKAADRRPDRSASSCSIRISSAAWKRSKRWRQVAHEPGALFVVSFDPISLGLLKRPGEYGADIVVAEGQSLGSPMALRRPVPGHPGLPRRIRPPDAGPDRRPNGRSPRQTLLGADAANPRAAHPPRKGHQQHLHEPGPVRPAGGGLSGRAGPAGLRETAELVPAQSALRRRSSWPSSAGVSAGVRPAVLQGVRRCESPAAMCRELLADAAGRRLSSPACRWAAGIPNWPIASW